MSDNRPRVWVWFKGESYSFALHVARVTRLEVENIQKKHRKIVFRNHQREYEIDNEASTRDLFKALVVGWKDLTQRCRRFVLCQKRTPDSPPDGQVIEPKFSKDGTLSSGSLDILVEMEQNNLRFAQTVRGCWESFDQIYEGELMSQEEDLSDEQKGEVLEEEGKN